MLKDEKILILLPRQLGDVLLGTPIPKVLKNKNPRLRIDWWAHPMAEQILAGNPWIDSVFYYPTWTKKKLNFLKPITLLKHLFFWIIYAYKSVLFLFKIRAQKYDIVIDAINYPRSTQNVIFSGAKTRISFRVNKWRDNFYTHLISKEDIESGYLGHTKLRLLDPLNIRVNSNELIHMKPEILISEENKIRPTQFVQDILKLGTPHFCVMSPAHRAARIANRSWNRVSYMQLAFEIIKKYNCAVVWLYGPGEESYVNAIDTDLKNLLKTEKLNEKLSLVSPPFSLRESGYLSSLAKGWIGNSNGMSHVSIACGAKAVSIYGPTNPKPWCHPDSTISRGVQRKIGCVSCSKNTCFMPYRECLDDLTVTEVIKEVDDLFFKAF